MTKKTAKKKSPRTTLRSPVIYVHARDHAPLDHEQARSLAALGPTVCTRLEVKGTEKTTNGYGHPDALLAELGSKYPGRPIIVMRAGLQPTAPLLADLASLAEQAGPACVLVPLSNAVTGVNPFAGLHAPADCDGYDFAGMVSLLAPGQLYPLTEWPDHFTWYSAEAVQALSSCSGDGSVMQRLASAGVAAVLADHLFILDPESAVFADPDAKTGANQTAPPVGVLSARLQAWLNEGIGDLPVPATGKPATLHITHSWGGGVAQWIESFIEADKGHRHFQLRSESADSKPPFGLKLSLYAASEMRCPIASWWLQPPIESIVDADPGYAHILSGICRRFGIGRVMVSSLIGHSLDVLRTGLPTIQVLHDHFPLWPLLGTDPEPYLTDGAKVDLARALNEHQKSRTFLDQGTDSWAQRGAAYLQAMTDHGVKVAAPGQWVSDLQRRIEPEFAKLDSTVIPHGYPVLAQRPLIEPKPRQDGRLRMVILGRAQEGKGSKLLLDALPKLAEHVQVYLLGTGNPGKAFFGIPGVDVVLEYDRKELGEMLESIGPDFAALLSVVPETFSYTLSELQQLGIPAIATRVGSFPHRIEHGETGWLVDANADALEQQVTELCSNPGALDTVRKNLPSITPGSLKDMVKAYNKLCPPAKKLQPFAAAVIDSAQAQLAAAEDQVLSGKASLREAAQTQQKLARDAAAMAEWAKEEHRIRKQWVGELESELENERQIRKDWVASLEKEIEKEKKIREDWVAALEKELRSEQERLNKLAAELQQRLEDAHAGLQHLQSELQTKQEELQATETELQHAQAERDNTGDRLARLEVDYQHVAGKLDDVLASTSWRITAPLRATRRLATNLLLARAWNPLRWPWLAANMIRNLRGLGFAGTLRRMQTSRAEDTPAPPSMAHTLPPAPDTRPGQAPAYFPQYAQPDASIVIPVYNQWAYTAACLASLRSTRSRHTFEVIVVDDQSSDETAAELAKTTGITTLRNEENLGFLGSCNRGTEHARGQLLVLLNNDTQVTDGWLDELADTFSAQPEAGLIGSRLVYPDGRLQESGGIIYSDASGWNYGRDDDADRPDYAFLRESDYCSGACIAVRTSLFRELGGLDERYAPAYYEDTDLAFRVREAGYKVYVQPSSVVVHHEGITSGIDTSSGTKRYQVVNQQKFLERWQAELAGQPDPITDHSDPVPVRRATRHRQTGRVLFIDAFTPKPDRDSGSLRLFNLIRLCRDMGYGVTFFADNLAYAGRYTRDLQKAGIEVFYAPWIESAEGFFQARGSDFDFIVASRYYVANNYIALARRHCPDASFIFDTVDLHYLRERRQGEFERSAALKLAARQTRRAELAVIRAADATLVVSPDEQALLAEDAPGSEVHLLSNIHEVPGRNGAFGDRKDIYFVGAYRHPPNVDAALWFVKEVWPLVSAALPGVCFHLIGNDAPAEVSDLQGDGVVFHGYVESLQPFLDGCRLAVAPLRYGAGVKGKVNMSMAHGQPLVATPIAAEGLSVEHEKECLLADDAESFAGEVIRLYQDEELWRRLSDAGVANVEKYFSMAAARERLANVFDALAGQRETPAD